MPEELSPAEEAAERAKQVDKEALEKRRTAAPQKPLAVIETMRACLVQMKKEASGDDAKSNTAFKTLMKYISNIAQVHRLTYSSKQRCLTIFMPVSMRRLARTAQSLGQCLHLKTQDIFPFPAVLH